MDCGAAGYNIVRNTHLLGITEGTGHAEVAYENVRVKIKDALLGKRGQGFMIAQVQYHDMLHM